MRRPSGPDDHSTSQCYLEWGSCPPRLALPDGFWLASCVHYRSQTAWGSQRVGDAFGEEAEWVPWTPRVWAEQSRFEPDAAQVLADGWCLGLHADRIARPRQG